MAKELTEKNDEDQLLEWQRRSPDVKARVERLRVISETRDQQLRLLDHAEGAVVEETDRLGAGR